ncbi:NAD(P)/FAD-dependent oxidoreductase [Nocardioides sp.]|uniref:dihydrolipoyl dehydrogenase family protein n=1 Tax=Nocardioides sp. TaxID=35761 RepID=UPI0031FED5A1|nr:NAD(P)/FAD-dependent oxidoreductase [Nocardioides sp.]
MQVDVVVLGLGPGGELVATKLARAGLSVVGVDRHLVGGECPFYGCTPSKLVVRSSDVLGEARRVDGLAGTASVHPSWAVAAARIRTANHEWHDDAHVTRLEEAGVTVVRGHGRLDGPGRVTVERENGSTDEYVAARGIVLNAGTEPARPAIDGLADTPYWTNREVFKITELPASLAVVGAGAVGCELAQAFSRFGVRVTLIESLPRILAAEEPESSTALAEVLGREGIDVVTGAEIRRVRHDGSFHLDLADRTIDVDELLVAAGRRSNLSDLGLDSVGLDPSAKSVETDERLRAGERLWAVGDITGKGEFTHVSLYQARVVIRDILGQDGPWADYRGVSRVTFTDPEIGSVGMTEEQAREDGIDVRIGRADLAHGARGWMHGPDTVGLVKLVADAERGILVGGTVVGPYGGEALGLLSAAVHAAVPVSTLKGTHFAYPTFHRTIESALWDLGI